MISHHPQDDLLLSYSAGALGEGWSLAVATHLSYCPYCKTAVDVADCLGGAFLADEEPETMASGCFEAMIDKIEAPRLGETVDKSTVALRSKTVIPQPLRNYIGDCFEKVAWKPIGGGAEQYLIATGDKSQARLLKIPAGQPVPEHTHGGRELTLVLAGSFSDDEGKFGPGDLEDVDEETTHQPVAGPEEACICLVVTDAPLQFSELLPRLFQRVINI